MSACSQTFNCDGGYLLNQDKGLSKAPDSRRNWNFIVPSRLTEPMTCLVVTFCPLVTFADERSL